MAIGTVRTASHLAAVPDQRASRPRVMARSDLRQPGHGAALAPGRLSVLHGALLLGLERVHRPAEQLHRPPQLHQPVGQRRVPPDLPERVRLLRPGRGRQDRPGDLAGPLAQPAALVQAADPRLRAAALGDPDRAVDPRLVMDVQFALQRRQLDPPRHRHHRPARAQLARPEVLRDGRRDHRQHLARPALLRDHAPGGPGRDPEGALRGGRGRRRGADRALLARHPAVAQGRARDRRALLHDLHVQRVQYHLRPDPRRPDQLDPPVRDPGAPGRPRDGPDRRGRRDLALSVPGADAGGVGAAALRQKAGLLMKHRKLVNQMLAHLALLPFIIFAVFPFYHMALTSLKQNRELYDRTAVPLLIRQGPTLEHYKRLLWETEFITWTQNSLLVTILATVVSLVIGTIAAYALARLKFFAVASLGTGIFVTYLVPTSLLFLPLAQVVNWLGLGDSKWALVVTYPTFLVPFCTWLLMGYFRTVPKEVEECAMVDGCNRLQTMLRVLLPIAVPGLVCAALFAFTFSWNEFIYALTFTSSSDQITASVGVTSELIRGDIYYWGSLMAGAVLASVPIVILYVFFLDYYVSGLTAGSVK